MNNFESIQTGLRVFLKKWWCSLLLLPLVYFTLHQLYWGLRFNIFFMVMYDFPFPVNFIYFLLDNFLLIVHEAGHTFFSITGVRFITILGGSLFQILLPLGIFIYTLVNRQKYGMQCSLFLLGFSWIDVAGYAADGGQQQLPLIGGLGRESHDWMNLLTDMNMLDQDLAVGIAFAVTGVVCYLSALLLPAVMKEYEVARLDLGI